MTNFLDMRCPKCGDEDSLDIRATVWIRVCEDGSDADASHDGSHYFGARSRAQCGACGHCGTVTAGFEVLKKFYGDNNHLELHTTTPGEPSRVIELLSTGEKENDQSRLYGGIHYPFDIAAAHDMGQKIADYVLEKWSVTAAQ